MLSEAERRKLTEIESHLRGEDPAFVQRFRDGGRPQPGWRGRVALLAGGVAVVVAGFGLVVGSIGTVVVALTAIGASAGMWVNHRCGRWVHR
jgi:hypothetical protein